MQGPAGKKRPYHSAGKLADAIIEEGKCGEVLGDN